MIKIESNPTIQAYAHHAYLAAIIEGVIEYESSGAALRMEVAGAGDYSWINASKIIQNGDVFELGDMTFDPETYEFVYRECNPSDELIVRIDSLQNKAGDAILNLAVCTEEFEEAIRKNRECYKCGYLYNHFLTRTNALFGVNEVISQEKYRYVRLVRDGAKVFSYVSLNGSDWELIEEQEIFEAEKKGYIGFIAEQLGRENLQEQYLAWKYSNFMQVRYNTKDIGYVFLDYYNFPLKNAQYENIYANHFFDICYEEPKEICDLCGDVVTYVDWCLEHEYFLNVNLDEFYIEGRSRFQKEHFNHPNLIYGYDETKGTYLVLGYEVKLMLSQMTKEQMQKATERMQGKMARYAFRKNRIPFQFDFNKLYFDMENFMAGNNAFKSYANILTTEGSFGVDAFREIMETKKGVRILLSDRRISYMLFEHSKIMEGRIGYLKENGYFDSAIADYFIEALHPILELATQIKNLVIKNFIRPTYAEQIKTLYQEWYEKYVPFMKELYTYVREKIET